MSPISMTLPYPVSANKYWRHIVHNGQPKTLISREARAYREEVGWIARARCLKPIEGPVSLAFELYPAANDRCMDLDNAQKVVLDALKNVAFGDDSLVWEIHAKRMRPDATGARIVVHIEPMFHDEPKLETT